MTQIYACGPATPRRETTWLSFVTELLFISATLRLPSSRLAFDRETSYWIGAKGAAEILGVNASRLNQLVAKGRVPFEVHADGRRLYRRDQLLTVANARDARWH